MAECHPVRSGGRSGQAQGRELDPRRSAASPVRSAVADIHARSAPARRGVPGRADPLRLESERWRTGPVFKEFVVNYTNAGDAHRRRLQGYGRRRRVFSGLMQYAPGVKECRSTGSLVSTTRDRGGTRRRPPATPRRPPARAPVRPLVRSLLTPPPRRDETLADPRTVFQYREAALSRYTPRWSSRSPACPKETFSRWRRRSSPTRSRP